MEELILVNSKDEETGTIEKMEGHKKGLLHRAISVIIFNSSGDILLQKRAKNKYHSGGLWSNSTCTHPKKGEKNIDAAKRRLKEEMGITADLEEKFSFIYKAFLDNNMIEHEYDYVFFGVTDQLPILNKNEVSDYKYITYLNLINDIEMFPDNYTTWFKIILKEAEREIFKTTNYLSNNQK